MLKVAVLDDYQNAFQQIVEVDKHKDKFEFKIFNNPFNDEKEAIVELEDFEALLIMRERTPMTRTLIESLIYLYNFQHLLFVEKHLDNHLKLQL